MPKLFVTCSFNIQTDIAQSKTKTLMLMRQILQIKKVPRLSSTQICILLSRISVPPLALSFFSFHYIEMFYNFIN